MCTAADSECVMAEFHVQAETCVYSQISVTEWLAMGVTSEMSALVPVASPVSPVPACSSSAITLLLQTAVMRP